MLCRQYVMKMLNENSGMALHFKGISTGNGTLPMDYLEDIGRFGRVLKTLSKEMYIYKNKLKKAPAGFKGIEFVMNGLQTGSTIVRIEVGDSGLTDTDIATTSYDIVSKHLSGIGIDMSDYPGYEKYNPTKIVERECKGLWKNLDETVSLEFNNYGKKYSFDKNNRGKITDKRESNSNICITGSIYEMDCDSRKFKMKYLDNSGRERTAVIYYGEMDETIIMDAMKNRVEMKVCISGKGSFNGDNLKEVELVDFKQLHALDPTSRLEDIIRIVSKTIKNGAELSGYVSSIRSLERIIEENYCSMEPMYIYPTPDNNLEFEWANNGFVLSLDVRTMNAEFIGESDDEDFEMDMKERGSWDRLCGLIDDGTRSC